MTFSFKNIVIVPVRGKKIVGDLSIPDASRSLVIFAHGSGSDRFCAHNNYVANILHEKQIGTLLFDLLTEEENRLPEKRFDINILTERLMLATEFLCRYDWMANYHIGYFGENTGAALALNAAAAFPGTIKAVVTQAGKVEGVFESMEKLKAATLLIVGDLDTEVLNLNKSFFDQMTCPKKLEVVEKSTNLHETTMVLAEVAMLAAEWFSNYLKPEGGTI